MRWKRSFTNVPNIAGSALEKITAVATMPVPDELHVLEPVHLVDDGRPQAEPERQQVDHRLEHAREGRRLPEGAEVRDLAAHHAADGGGLQASHSASSPVSSTNTSSSDAARRIASGGTTPFVAFSAPTIAMAGPAGRTFSPAASAFARTSASRSGGA